MHGNLALALSGVGIAVAGGIYVVLKSRVRQQPPPEDPTEIDPLAELDRLGTSAPECLSAFELRRREANLSPSERAGFLQSCVGLPVRWPVVLHTVNQNEDRSVRVFASYGFPGEVNQQIIVVFGTTLKEHPTLKFVHGRERLWIEGEIKSAEHIIELENVRIEFCD